MYMCGCLNKILFELHNCTALYRTYYALLNSDLHNMVDVWVPDTQDTISSPILYMVGGLGGLLPGAGYETIFNRYCVGQVDFRFLMSSLIEGQAIMRLKSFIPAFSIGKQ